MAGLGVSLNSSLLTIGISSAKGVETPMLRDQIKGTLPQATSNPSTTSSQSSSSAQQTTAAATTSKELTPEQQRQVADLKRIEANVIAHEQAHMAVGRDLVTSGPSYSYTYGPDGKPYAIGGEVNIDTSPEQKPEANISKGEHIVETALAPRDPSTQDYRVAAVGTQMADEGRVELASERSDSAQQKLEQTYGAQNGSKSGTVNVLA